MTRARPCPACDATRLLSLKALKLWICYACHRQMRRLKQVSA